MGAAIFAFCHLLLHEEFCYTGKEKNPEFTVVSMITNYELINKNCSGILFILKTIAELPIQCCLHERINVFGMYFIQAPMKNHSYHFR
jgi:hypothetical protein